MSDGVLITLIICATIIIMCALGSITNDKK
jgi:hypothetical protein